MTPIVVRTLRCGLKGEYWGFRVEWPETRYTNYVAIWCFPSLYFELVISGPDRYERKRLWGSPIPPKPDGPLPPIYTILPYGGGGVPASNGVYDRK